MTSKYGRAAAVVSAVVLVVPVVAVVAVSPGVAGAAKTTRVLTCTGRPTSKPRTYTLSCADANAEWADVTWSAWNARAATGHGILRQNDCTPNCAAGQFVNYRATVTLSKVIATTKYGDLFSTALFHYVVNGITKTETFGLAD